MNSRRIVDFYDAFRRLDAAAMRSAYAPRARFSGPAFTVRGADDIGAMWALLCEAIDRQALQKWQMDVSDVEATAKRGRARWEPRYRIRASGRYVHSVIHATFTFDKEGRILSHEEHFSFWRWSHQALGLRGMLLGWSPLLRMKMRAALNQSLAAHRQPPYQTTVQLLTPATMDGFPAL